MEYQINPASATVCMIAVAVVAAGLVAAASVIKRFAQNRRLDSIPGPSLPYPIIGLGYRLPHEAPTLLRKWAMQYGELFKIRVGWYDWVVINSPDAIREILEKQAVITSAKVPSPMGHDTVTRGHRMFTLPYGQYWRTQRSVLREVLSGPMTATYVPTQEFETKQLLFDLATNNEDQRSFYRHIRRYSFGVLITSAFGTRVQSLDHPDAQDAVRSQDQLRATSHAGAFIVDELPPLAYLPKWLQPGRARAERAARIVNDIKMKVWRRFEEQYAAGTAPHCYAKTMMDKKDHWHSRGLTDLALAWITGGLTEAGFETTGAALNNLVLHLAANSHVQQKAHEELMRVVGPDRMPTFDDLGNLPYVRACVKETLRMHPILSPGVRSMTASDVHYKGHVIPKGTVLLTNTAFLHYDPSRFKRPFEFMPERYINHDKYSADYAALGDPLKRDHYTFSTGRRVCPGARLAENSLMIALAGIMWAFEIRPPFVEGTNEKVEAEMEVGNSAYPTPGFTIPKPFAVRFVPRTEDHLRQIKEGWDKASKEGYELRGVQVDLDGMVKDEY